jgi:LPXTG-motif cell wall-anchored protein
MDGGNTVGKSQTLIGTIAIALVLALSALVGSAVNAAGAPTVALGTASSFAVLAGAGITNTGPSVINGDVGSFGSSTSVGGFPPGLVNGTNHGGDAVTQGAKTDLVTAYDDAAGRSPSTIIPTELGGSIVLPGFYASAAGTFGITGNVTLDAQGDPNSVFVFQMASTLTTATGSSVSFINGAQSCNVFWQVGSSATLGGATSFKGTILALTSITLVTGATIDGRALARNGAVTLDTNTITASPCAPAPTAGPRERDTATPAPSAAPAPTATPAPSPMPTATPRPSAAPTATPAPAAVAPVATSTPTPIAAPTRPVAVRGAQTLPSTSTADGSAPLLLGGLLLIVTGALLVRSRRSVPTDR